MSKYVLIECYVFRCEARRERESTAGWYRPCLLSFVWFTGRNIFYSSSWNICKDKTKIFSHCFQAGVMWSSDQSEPHYTPAALWCPPAWLGTTPVPRSTRPLSTATKVRSPGIRLELWQSSSVFRWPQAGGLGRSSVPASSSSPTTTAGSGISVWEIQLLR